MVWANWSKISECFSTRQQVPLTPFPQTQEMFDGLKQLCEVIIDEAAESIPCMGKVSQGPSFSISGLS